MSKLDYLTVPLWSPPDVELWRIRSTRPSGETYVFLGYLNLYNDKAEADYYCDWANGNCREDCAYDVISA